MKISDSKKELVRNILTRDMDHLIFENVQNENEAVKIIKKEKFCNTIPFEDKGKIRFLFPSRALLAKVSYNPQGSIIYYPDGKKESGGKSGNQVKKQIINHYGYPDKAKNMIFEMKDLDKDLRHDIIGTEPFTHTYYDKNKKILHIYN